MRPLVQAFRRIRSSKHRPERSNLLKNNRVCLFYHGLSNSQTFSSSFNSVGLRKVQYNEFSAGTIYDTTKRSFEDVKQDISVHAKSGDVDRLRLIINTIFDNYPEDNLDEYTLSSIFDAYSTAFDEMNNNPMSNVYSGNKWELVNDIDDFLQDVAVQNANMLVSKHFTIVLSLWNRLAEITSNLRGIPERATSQLHMMERLALDGNLKVRPTIQHYNTVIQIWSKIPSALSPFRADSIVRRIGGFRKDITTVISKELDVKLNAETCRIMIQSWSDFVTKGIIGSKRKFGGAAYNASGYLRFMISSFEMGDKSFEPNLDDYLMVFRAWAKASESQMTGKRALFILNKMESLFKNEQTEVRPNLECYKLVLGAISNCKPPHIQGMGDDAERILSRIEENGLTPDSECYSYLIKTWSTAAQHNELTAEEIYSFASKANNVLDKMSQMYLKSGTVLIRPTTVDYDNVMCAWSKCQLNGVAEKVENLLNNMEQLNDDGDICVLPSRNSYLYAIKSWKNSPNTSKQIQGAMNVMKRFKAQYTRKGNSNCKPSVDCFNAVISVCGSRNLQTASDEVKREGLKCLLDTMHEMRNLDQYDGHPESSTYNLLLEAFSVLLIKGSKEYQRAIESAFTMCRKEGLVDDKVLKTFHRVAPYESYRKLVLSAAYPRIKSDGTVSDDMLLPDEWSKNTTRLDKSWNVPLSLDGRLVYDRCKTEPFAASCWKTSTKAANTTIHRMYKQGVAYLRPQSVERSSLRQVSTQQTDCKDKYFISKYERLYQNVVAKLLSNHWLK